MSCHEFYSIFQDLSDNKLVIDKNYILEGVQKTPFYNDFFQKIVKLKDVTTLDTPGWVRSLMPTLIKQSWAFGSIFPTLYSISPKRKHLRCVMSGVKLVVSLVRALIFQSTMSFVLTIS